MSNVIIGGCREELSLYRNALTILDSMKANGGSAAKAVEVLNASGTRITTLKFADPDMEKFSSEVATIVSAADLPAAMRELSKRRRSPIPSAVKAGVTVAEGSPLTADHVLRVVKKYGSKYDQLVQAVRDIEAKRLARQESSTQDADVFYRRVAMAARAAGSTVSVLTMEGEDCKLENLGVVADATNGQVDVVDPVKLQEKAEQLLRREAKAIETKIAVHFGKHVAFLAEPTDVVTPFAVSRELGIVTNDADITFAYGPTETATTTLRAVSATSGEPPEDMVDLPFQVVLEWTDPKTATKSIRALSARRDFAWDRGRCEAYIDSATVAVRAIHASAAMAQQGKYTDARINLVSTLRLLQRTLTLEQHSRDYMSFVVQAEKLDGFMREAIAAEQVRQTTTGDRSKTRDDDASKAMYQMKAVSLKAFQNRT